MKHKFLRNSCLRVSQFAPSTKTIAHQRGERARKEKSLKASETYPQAGGNFVASSLPFRGVALIAVAAGAFAVGAFAIGALVIGRLAIRRVVVGCAEFKSVRIHDLTVDRLSANEVALSDSPKLPATNVDRETR